jgi:hypothetical protein
MKTRNSMRTPLAIAVALTLCTTAYNALAETAPNTATKATASAPASAQDHDLMRLSNDGFQAMRAVRSARIAIFNGNPKIAKEMLDKAKVSLHAAAKDAPIFVVDVKTGVKGEVVNDTVSVDQLNLIPIDGQIVLADSFVDSPAKKAHIDKSNQHISKGESKQAIDELKLAEVDATFSRVLMPLQSTTRLVDDAAKLVTDEKFYQANLALKAAEDGLRFDSVALSEAPKKAAKAK